MLIVQKLLETTGEALNAAAHLDSTVSDRIPEHRRIVAMRNRITHGYDSVDIDVLWSTVRLGIPELHGTPVALLEDAPAFLQDLSSDRAVRQFLLRLSTRSRYQHDLKRPPPNLSRVPRDLYGVTAWRR